MKDKAKKRKLSITIPEDLWHELSNVVSKEAIDELGIIYFMQKKVLAPCHSEQSGAKRGI